jgi:hypothetical protein
VIDVCILSCDFRTFWEFSGKSMSKKSHQKARKGVVKGKVFLGEMGHLGYLGHWGMKLQLEGGGSADLHSRVRAGGIQIENRTISLLQVGNVLPLNLNFS